MEKYTFNPPVLTQFKINIHRLAYKVLYWPSIFLVNYLYYCFIITVPFISKTFASYFVMAEGYIVLAMIYFWIRQDYIHGYSKITNRQCEDLIKLSKREPEVEIYHRMVALQKRDLLQQDYITCLNKIISSKK